MDKKTLIEVFEFFPKAKWITQGGKDQFYEIKLHTSQPTIVDYNWWRPNTKIELLGWQCSFTDTNLRSSFKIDWKNRRTWQKRIVSRQEIMEEG